MTAFNEDSRLAADAAAWARCNGQHDPSGQRTAHNDHCRSDDAVLNRLRGELNVRRLAVVEVAPVERLVELLQMSLDGFYVTTAQARAALAAAKAAGFGGKT